jgi:hypothetical protein
MCKIAYCHPRRIRVRRSVQSRACCAMRHEMSPSRSSAPRHTNGTADARRPRAPSAPPALGYCARLRRASVRARRTDIHSPDCRAAAVRSSRSAARRPRLARSAIAANWRRPGLAHVTGLHCPGAPRVVRRRSRRDAPGSRVSRRGASARTVRGRLVIPSPQNIRSWCSGRESHRGSGSRRASIVVPRLPAAPFARRLGRSPCSRTRER